MKRYEMLLWASGANAQTTDPDLDPNHPSGNGGPGKYAKGWIPEKEPHQWINFLYGAQDALVYQAMSYGSFVRDASVRYKLGAIQANAGIWVVATKDNPSAADWTPVAGDGSKAVHDAWITRNTNNLNTHTAKLGPNENVHNTTIGQAGGYTKQEANSKDTTNKTNIENHKKNVSNPHKVTYTQINCLSSSIGGNFTGSVKFPKVVLATDIGIRDALELYTSKEGFGISTDPWLSVSKQEVLTENSYIRNRNKYEPSFALPPVDIFVPLSDSLHSPSSGAYTLEYSRPSTLVYQGRHGSSATAGIDEPAFEISGLKLSTDYTLMLGGLISGVGTLCYDLDGETKVFLIDLVEDDLSFYLGKVGNAKNLRIWLTPLTDEQKSMLGATNG